LRKSGRIAIGRENQWRKLRIAEKPMCEETAT
jgi:hypothetical protein